MFPSKLPRVLVFLVLALVTITCNQNSDKQPVSPSIDINAQKGLPIPPGPPPPQETNAWVVVYGGTHTGAGSRSVHQSIISKALAFHSSHIFSLGDLTEDGTNAQQWLDFKSDIAPINPYPIKYYPMLGEHEDPATYFSEFPNLPTNGGQADPYYYYDTHLTSLFIVLDISSVGATTPAGFATQKAWLEGVLQNHAGDNKFRFVFFHVPSLRTNASVGRAEYAAELDPIFQQYGVDVVFMGHTHGYQRWNVGGVHYIVTAGAGAPLETIANFPSACVVNDQDNHYVEMFLSGNNGTLSVKDLSGNEIDALTLLKGQGTPPPPTEERVAIHGDTHGGQSATADAVHASVVARILGFGPDLILNTGDVVQNTNPTVHFGILNDIRSSLCEIPYYPTLGNHDGSGQPDYLANFPYLPENGDGPGKYYYVDTEFARIICLEVDKQGATPPTNWGAQKAWLNTTLESAGDVFKFVFFHVPRSTTGTMEMRGKADYADQIEATLSTHGVHAVFVGHTHSYQRWDNYGSATGITQIVTGGAGGFLHEFSPEPFPGLPFYERHNYLEMVLTESVATITAFMLPDNATSGTFAPGDTVTISK